MKVWAVLVSVFALFAVQPVIAAAQSTSWLQVEAQPDLATAQERARAFATLFPNVQGFQTGAWYAVVLGPMTREEAGASLLSLRSENLIPRDSFIADGSDFDQQFWPVGGQVSAAEVGQEPAATTEAVTESAAEPAPVPEETLAEAREAEAALSKDEREALQEALAWFGFYKGGIDGAYGKGTRASFAAWQQANGFEPTGVLRTKERAQLLTAEADEKEVYGFDLVTETESGIEASLPMALVAFQNYEPPFVQFPPREPGGPRLMLISEPGDRASLAGLYDLLQSMETVPAPDGAAAPDRSLGNDSFTINASSANVATYAWARAANGQVKGFILTWTPDNAAKMARMVDVIQTSFRSVGDKALDPGLIPLDEAARQGLLTGLTPRKPVFTRSGFYVSGDGAILTLARGLDTCRQITIDGDLDVSLSASDPASGAALLTPATTLSPPAVAAFGNASVPRGTEIIIAGYAYGDKLPAPVLTFGRLDELTGLTGEPGINRLSAPVLDSDQGGPVLASSGAVIGLLTGPGGDPAKKLPAGVVFSADAAALTSFLSANGTPPQSFTGADLSPDALSKLALGMTLRVDCWQ